MSVEEGAAPAKVAFPPVIYLLCLAAGLALELLWPSTFIPGPIQYVIGGATVLVSVLPMPFVLRRFKKSGTSFDSRGPSTALLQDGPYRYSRNPAYLCMTLLYVGVAVLIDSAWILAFAIVGFVLMDRVVVAREEADLERRFGDDYRAYSAAVRRWI